MSIHDRGFGSARYDAGRATEVRRLGAAAQAAAGKRFSFADDPAIARRAGLKSARRRRAKRRRQQHGEQI
jgi:hypothetical protein